MKRIRLTGAAIILGSLILGTVVNIVIWQPFGSIAGFAIGFIGGLTGTSLLLAPE